MADLLYSKKHLRNNMNFSLTMKTALSVLSLATLLSAHTLTKIENITVTTSTSEQNYAPENLVDGDLTTRWGSEFQDNQEIILDLRKPYSIDKLVFYWEAAYALNFVLYTSEDGSEWLQRTGNISGIPGVQEFPWNGTYRYIKIALIDRAIPYGFSLWELEVYTSDLEGQSVRLKPFDSYVNGRPSCTRENVGQIVSVQQGYHGPMNYVVQACVGHDGSQGVSAQYDWVTIADGNNLPAQ